MIERLLLENKMRTFSSPLQLNKCKTSIKQSIRIDVWENCQCMHFYKYFLLG